MSASENPHPTPNTHRPHKGNRSVEDSRLNRGGVIYRILNWVLMSTT